MLRKKFQQATRFSILSAVLTVGCAVPLEAQLPTGGSVASGAGTILQNGAGMIVNQSSQKLGLNWQSFNIGAGNSVNFVQPNASSIALNRVLGNNASSIFGSLQANGSVFLVNPNGVLFAPGAQVSVGGLVASTLNLSDADFAAGKYLFKNNGNAGSVINQGHIQAGNVALLGPQIVNNGVINAPGGTVALAAGDAITVTLLDSGLLTAHVDKTALSASIQNHGQIFANGGQVQLLADAIQDTLINTDGLIQAKSLVNKAGHIYLSGGANGTVTVSGTLDASGAETGTQGGEIKVLGKQVGLLAGANLNASGDMSGGTVLVGGNWHGQGPEQDASATYMDSSASIHADATGTGNGGQVVLWSNDYTGFYGNISARGGAVETSSHNNLQAFGRVDTSTWLLDPADVTISSTDAGYTPSGGNPNVFQPNSGASTATINAATINTSLNTGTGVTIATTNTGTAGAGAGNITVNSPISKTAGGNATLLLQADHSIVVKSNITSTSGALNVTLDAHYSNDTNPGSVLVRNAAINTNGGDITIGGGANPSTTPAIGIPAETTLVGTGVALIAGATLNAGGGNISVRGQGAAADNNAGDTLIGIDLNGGAINTVQTSGNGNITLIGSGGSGTAPLGAGIDLASSSSSSSQNIVTAQNGNISMQGTRGTGTGTNWYGVRLVGLNAGANKIYTSGTGNATINAVTGNVVLSDSGSNHSNDYLGWDGGTTVSGGTVTVSSAAGTVDLANSLLTPTIKSANATNAINISAATGILGGANLTATNNGAASVTNTTSGNISLGTVNAGTGAVTILNGPNSGTLAATGAISTGAVTGGAVSIKDTMANAGSTVTYSSISANGNVDVWQSTTSNDLTIGSGNPITENSASPTTVTLKSGRSIVVTGGIADAGTGPMSTVLDAHYTNDANPGSVAVNGANINTTGGDITIGGGANPATTPAIGVPGEATIIGAGVFVMNSATLNAAGGNILIRGQGAIGDTNSGDSVIGIDLNQFGTNTIQTSGNGNITLLGAGGSGSAIYGVGVDLSTVNSSSQNIVTAQSGNINIQGTAGTAANFNFGVRIAALSTGPSKVYTSGAGNVTLNAVSGNVTFNPSVAYVGWDGGATVSGGTVTVSSANGAVDLTSSPVPTIKSANATNAINISAATGILGGANLTATNNGAISVTNSTSGNIALGTINAGTGSLTVLNRLTPGAGTGTISLGPVTGGATSITDNFTGLTNGNTAISLGGAVIGTGPVTIDAQSGDLPVNVAINTTDTSPNAITLGAGSNTAAPTATGGNVTLGGGGSLTTGAGGRALIYSGSVAGTTGFGTLTPSGSGRFRYGRNYGDTSLLAAAPTSGAILQYRERPALTLTPNPVSTTYNGITLNNTAYSDTFANSGTTGWMNGDSGSTTGSALTGSLAFNGSTSTTVRNVGTYGMTAGTLAQSYGYTLNVIGTNNYVINPAPITVTGVSNIKTYDGTTSAAATPIATSGSLFGTDTFSTLTESYTSKSAGTGLTLTTTAGINDGNGGNNYTLTTVNNTSGVINKAPLTITAATNTKTYDGATGAAASPIITAGSLMPGDSVSSLSEAYAGKNAGTNLTLIPTAAINDGNGGNNYAVTAVNNTTGVINRAGLTLSANAATRTYDGTTASSATPTLTGLVGGDTSSGNGLEAYASKNAGTGLTLIPGVGTLLVNDGNGGNNYTITTVNNTAGVINPMPITVTAASNNKTYDGTTNAAATPAVISGSLVSGDSFSTLTESYTTKNAGAGLTLVPTVSVSDGNGGNNYAVTILNNTSGIINQALLTLSASAATKTYDGTTASNVMPALTGLVAGDTTSGAGIQTYNTRNAGTSLTLTSGMGTLAINDGNGGNNYALTMVNNTNGVINQAPLALTANADTKTYDGTTASSVIPTLSGLVGGDTASGNGVEAFNTRNAGTGLTLISSQGTLAINDGNGGNNYALTPVNTNGVINQALLTVTAVTNSKTYDGTTSTAAAPAVTGSLISGDTFTTLTEAYVSKNAGTNLTISPVVAINDGNGGNNYAVTAINNTTGVINPLTLTVTAVAASKVYDGTTSAAATPQITGSIATGDTAGFIETYNTKNVGSGWTLTPSGAVNDGNAGNNYAVTLVSDAGGLITPLAIQVGLKVGGSRIYDATTTANSSDLQISNNVDGSDLILDGIGTMASANAGPEALLLDHGNLQGFNLSGSAASNYTLFGASGTVVVSPRPVNLIGSRMYDGTAGAVASMLTVTNPITGETVAVTSGSGALASKNVGSEAIASMGNLMLSDSNYTTTGGSGTVTISPAPIIVAALPNTKSYDSMTGAAATPVITSGSLMGTDSFSTLSETYGTKNAGTNLTLTPNVVINDGNGGNNYVLTNLTNPNGVINQAALLLVPNAVSVPYTGIVLNNTAYSDLLSSYTLVGLQGGDTLGSIGLSLTGSMAFNGGTTTVVQNLGAYLFGAGTLSPSLTSSNYTIAFGNPSGNAYTILRGMDPSLLTAATIVSSDASNIRSQTNAAQQQFDPDPSRPKCLLALEGGSMKLPEGLSDNSLEQQQQRACRSNR